MLHFIAHRPGPIFCIAALTFATACSTTPEAVAPVVDPAAEAATLWASNDPAPAGQLPTDITPRAYNLELTLDPRKETFAGEVHIEIELTKWRKHVWLHGANLNVTGVLATGIDRVVSGRYNQHNDVGLARVDFESALPPGRYILEIDYTAPWDENLKGLYRVQQGEDWYAFTQFEATSARFAFPCFDEPRFKTPFSIGVTVPDGQTVVTTTPERAVGPVNQDGHVRHAFLKTRPLPTYLIAFAVGPLDTVEMGALPPGPNRDRSLPVRGFSVKGKGMQMAYAMKQIQPILERLEAYFGRAYPFEKLDIIAVPDFASGAMENVGAVTFREVLLLVDEENASAWQRRAMVSVIAHEFAHMWFGNLVTMPWWDDIWLNEAFATWMAYRVVADLYPTLGLATALTERVHGAMGQDALTSARQIRQDIKSDDDIRNAFDSITYSKGGGVLGMFEQYLGAETFNAAIQAYMNKHAYGSATYSDLLLALDEAASAAGKPPVSEAFKTFLFQPGVPFLQTKLDCTGGAAQLTATQSRYFPLGSPGDKDKSWQVPVCVAAFAADGTRTKHCGIVDADHKTVSLGATCPASVFVNADAAGYYRFRHDGAAPAMSLLNEKEKLAYADALNAAFSAGFMELGAYLDAVAPLAQDEAFGVATSPLRTLDAIDQYLLTDKTRAAFSARVRAMYAPQLSRLGVSIREDESTDDRRLRASVLEVLMTHQADDTLLKQLAAQGERWLADAGAHEGLSTDTRRVTLEAAIEAGGAKAFDAVVKRIATEADPAFRTDLIIAAAAAQGEHVEKAHALWLSDTLRKNEVRFAVFSAFSHHQTRDAAWDYFVTNYDAVNARIPTTRQGAMVWVGAGFCDESKREALSGFFADKVEKLAGAPRNLKGATEAVSLCAARQAHFRPQADALFGAQP